MKATAEPLIPITATEKSWPAVISDLFKARLTTLVLVTTLVGFYLGSTGPFNYLLLGATLLGTALLACGAAALNQLFEREHDARMHRTADRPLPSGRMQPDTVRPLGIACAVGGLLLLAFGANFLTGLLGAATLVLYLFVYTPLKRLTWLNTLVGAVPGALPPLMGWTAATNELSAAGWSLFAVQFFWQIPHFMAIAWIYREDYARAGFQMLPVIDPEGSRTGREAVSHTLGLLCASLLPVLFGVAGVVYAGGALVLGLLFVWGAARFAASLDLPSARRLFYISIAYLPILLGLMMVDKLGS